MESSLTFSYQSRFEQKFTPRYLYQIFFSNSDQVNVQNHFHTDNTK